MTATSEPPKLPAQPYELSRGPAGVYLALAQRAGDPPGSALVSRSLPSCEEADARTRLLADAKWSKKIGKEAALAIVSAPQPEGEASLLLDSGARSPLGAFGRAAYPPEDCRRLGDAIATALARCHAQGIVHGGLSRATIWADQTWSDVRLTAFETAFTDRAPSLLLARGQANYDPRYAAPELSTDRMRADRRSDLYALGVVLFEALAGRPLFAETHALALRHAHSALEAPSLSSIRPEIPADLSAIVARLLSKDPDQRFQSAAGLRRALGGSSENPHQVRDFPLRPTAVLGRDAELQALSQALFTATPPGFTIVSGPSGSGKSVLLDQACCSADQLVFVGRGKCRQTQTGQPFAVLVEAIQSILIQIDADDSEDLEAQLDVALARISPENRQLLAAVLPRVGVQGANDTEVSPAPAAELEARIQSALKGLLEALGTLNCRIALVLDDLQWGDDASLAWLSSLGRDAAPPALPIAIVFREDGSPRSTVFKDLLRALGDSNDFVKRLALERMSQDTTAAIVAHCLGERPSVTKELAEALHARSDGSPLILVEELQQMATSGALYRDPDSTNWAWDLAKLSSGNRPDRVSDLMRARVQGLDANAKTCVATAACFGHRFSAVQIAALTTLDEATVFENLTYLEHIGLLSKSSVGEHTAQSRPFFTFAHDQIEEAATNLLPEADRLQLHARIGLYLLDKTPSGPASPIEAAYHLNLAAKVFLKRGQAVWLAQQNLKAAELACERAAHQQAWRLLTAALELVEPSWWQRHYDLCRDLHLDAVRLSCVNNAAEEGLRLTAVLLQHASSRQDQIAAFEGKLEVLKVLDQFDAVLDTGLEALALLGIAITPPSSMAKAATGLLSTHARIRWNGFSKVVSRPSMREPTASAAMRILAHLNTVAFLISPPLFITLLDTQLRLSLAHGNAPESANAYALYAIVLAGRLQSFRQAGQAATGALELASGYEQRYLPSTAMAANVFVMPWVSPLRGCVEHYKETFTLSLDLGTPEFANYHASAYAAFGIHCGPSLSVFTSEIRAMRSKVVPMGQQRLYAADLYLQFSLNLSSNSGDPFLLRGPIYDEIEDAIRHENALEMRGHFHLLKLMLRVLFDRPQDYETNVAGFLRSSEPFDGMYMKAAFEFYAAVAQLRFCNTAKTRRRVRWTLLRMRNWSRHAPSTFAHKALFLRAELASSLGRPLTAHPLFVQAAELAERSGFQLEAGLAFESAAEAARQAGLAGMHSSCIQQALRVYANLGARAKVREIQTRTAGSLESNSELRTSKEPLAGGANLDLEAILQTSQELSSGIDLKETLAAIMRTVTEVCGAQAGSLVATDNGETRILARAQIRERKLEVDLPTADETGDRVDLRRSVPTSLVAKVEAQGTPISLSDPSEDPSCSSDPYFAAHSPRSLLCFPVRYKDRAVATLVLSHESRRDAFGQEQLRVLQLLSTQAGISIENANLFEKQVRMSEAAQRFVPEEFLALLGKSEVDQVQLSDFVEAEMTILVCDIRGFTTTTETMTPKASFDLVNDFFALLGTAVSEQQGFVIKYMGDGLMALFPRSPADALKAARSIAQRVGDNGKFGIGIGVHTGAVAVGAVGETSRIQADVMSDVANVATRLESLTRSYDPTILVSESTYKGLSSELAATLTPLGKASLKGRDAQLEIYGA